MIKANYGDYAVFRVFKGERPKVSGGLAEGIHLFPFRTQKLSLHTPMVLGWQRPGRAGSRRDLKEKRETKVSLFSFPSEEHLLSRALLLPGCEAHLAGNARPPAARGAWRRQADADRGRERKEAAPLATRRDHSPE